MFSPLLMPFGENKEWLIEQMRDCVASIKQQAFFEAWLECGPLGSNLQCLTADAKSIGLKLRPRMPSGTHDLSLKGSLEFYRVLRAPARAVHPTRRPILFME